MLSLPLGVRHWTQHIPRGAWSLADEQLARAAQCRVRRVRWSLGHAGAQSSEPREWAIPQ